MREGQILFQIGTKCLCAIMWASPYIYGSRIINQHRTFGNILWSIWGALAENFMVNLIIHVPGDELQLHDVFFKDEPEEDEDDDLFDLF